MEDIEYIVTTPGEADTAPEGARKINANFDRLVAALPTKVSDLTNDLAYLSLTGALQYFYLKNQTYTREEINQKIAAIKTASFEVVDALPASGEENIIYLVPKDGEKPDTHDEYIWVDGAWELIGSTQIDLSNYLQKTGDASDTTVAFVSEAGDPTSGSKLSSLIGRIVKKISDIVSGAIAVAKAASADSATRAMQDGDGNKISDTYLKRSGGTMTGNLALSNEVRVNGAVGNLVGRFTWGGALKTVVGNTQDNLALLSNGDATLNGVAVLSGTKIVKTGTPAVIPGRLDAASGVMDYYKPSELTVKAANQDANGNDIPSTYATKEEVSSLSIGGVNYITGLKDGWEAGYVNENTGVVIVNANNIVTKDYQDISPLAGKRATISASDEIIDVNGQNQYYYFRYVFYDSNKAFISGGGKGSNVPPKATVEVPSTAAYVKVSIGVGVANYALNNFERVRFKMELGDYATDYSLAPQDIPTVNDLPSVYVDTVPTNPKDGDILITTTD